MPQTTATPTLAVIAPSPTASPIASPTPPSIDHCLADGRSLEFELAVSERIRHGIDQPALVTLDPGAVRISHESGFRYNYVAEYLVTVILVNRNIGPFRSYYSGWIFSTTCAALLATPP